MKRCLLAAAPLAFYFVYFMLYFKTLVCQIMQAIKPFMQMAGIWQLCCFLLVPFFWELHWLR